MKQKTAKKQNCGNVLAFHRHVNIQEQLHFTRLTANKSVGSHRPSPLEQRGLLRSAEGSLISGQKIARAAHGKLRGCERLSPPEREGALWEPRVEGDQVDLGGRAGVLGVDQLEDFIF